MPFIRYDHVLWKRDWKRDPRSSLADAGFIKEQQLSHRNLPPNNRAYDWGIMLKLVEWTSLMVIVSLGPVHQEWTLKQRERKHWIWAAESTWDITDTSRVRVDMAVRKELCMQNLDVYALEIFKFVPTWIKYIKMLQNKDFFSRRLIDTLKL
jgi:hypothetical protein